MSNANLVSCCIDGNLEACPKAPMIGYLAIPGERTCDSTIRAFCTDPKNANDPRCSCWKKPDELADPVKRKEWMCFSKDCFGLEKLVLREWRDEKCPDYVSCRSKIRLQGNLIALPAAIKQEQDCGGAGSRSETTIEDRRSEATKATEKQTQEWVLWLRNNSVWFMLAAVILVGFLFAAISRKSKYETKG